MTSGASVGPGSCPSGQAPTGLVAPRFDPSREATPWLHLRGQFSYHGEALISGTRAGLTALRDALTLAIEQRDAEAEVFASDGEGYAVTIRRCARIRDMGEPPYIDQLGRAVADAEREFMRKHERYQRDLWSERRAAIAMEARSGETGTGSTRKGDSAAIAQS